MNWFERIAAQAGEEWIPLIYKNGVRSQRTRSYSFEIPDRENEAVIQHTLLGIELKVGRRRFSCPDLSTARYLRVFARIGCREIAVPYDISQIPGLADELESAWQTALLFLGRLTKDSTPAETGKKRAALIRRIRRELNEIGAGAMMPEFKDSPGRRRS